MLYPAVMSPRASLGLLVLRIVIGLAFVMHGWPKMEHFSSWMTVSMGSHAFAPAWVQAVVTVVEFFGGIALIVGFLTPLVAAAILVDMAVAILVVLVPTGGHWIGGAKSFEAPLLYFCAMLAFLLIGPGRFSVDAMLARTAMRSAQA